jgi:hypothetical protein
LQLIEKRVHEQHRVHFGFGEPQARQIEVAGGVTVATRCGIERDGGLKPFPHKIKVTLELGRGDFEFCQDLALRGWRLPPQKAIEFIDPFQLAHRNPGR